MFNKTAYVQSNNVLSTWCVHKTIKKSVRILKLFPIYRISVRWPKIAQKNANLAYNMQYYTQISIYGILNY